MWLVFKKWGLAKPAEAEAEAPATPSEEKPKDPIKTGGKKTILPNTSNAPAGLSEEDFNQNKNFKNDSFHLI